MAHHEKPPRVYESDKSGPERVWDGFEILVLALCVTLVAIGFVAGWKIA